MFQKPWSTGSHLFDQSLSSPPSLPSAFLHSVITPSRKELLFWDLAPTVSEWSRQMRGEGPSVCVSQTQPGTVCLLIARGSGLWCTPRRTSLPALFPPNCLCCLPVPARVSTLSPEICLPLLGKNQHCGLCIANRTLPCSRQFCCPA